MLQNGENNGMEEIGLVTPTPGLMCRELGLLWFINGAACFGTKPTPAEPVLIYCQLDSCEQTSSIFQSIKINDF